jgi:hypothetical protein
MRSPSIAPQGFDVDVYVVLDDFGKLGRAYREIDEEAADKETVIRHLMEGQYNDPVRIVAFNTAEGWARDVTEDIATEIRDRVERSGEELSPGLRDFIEREIGRSKRLASLYSRRKNSLALSTGSERQIRSLL